MMRILFLLLIVVSHGTGQARAFNWAKTTNSGKEKTTTLEFYFHDTQSGKTPSAIPVAQPASSTKFLSGFGTLYMADDKLTVGPDPKSKMVGRAQGLYGSASQEDMSYIMAMGYNFIDGMYNGSSISITGRNWATNTVREMPVVGGTGRFRFARGYAVAHTYWVDFKTGDAIVGYNITIVH